MTDTERIAAIRATWQHNRNSVFGKFIAREVAADAFRDIPYLLDALMAAQGEIEDLTVERDAALKEYRNEHLTREHWEQTAKDLEKVASAHRRLAEMAEAALAERVEEER